MQRNTMTEIVNHSRSTALERSVKKNYPGAEINFTWPHSSPLILPWYTQDKNRQLHLYDIFTAIIDRNENCSVICFLFRFKSPNNEVYSFFDDIRDNFRSPCKV